MAAYGRPMKGKSRRTPITVHSSVGLLDTIDEYVTERDAEEASAYSRSDFFNEAALFYLQHLGREPEAEEVRMERNKIVAEKSDAQRSRENMENLGGESDLK